MKTLNQLLEAWEHPFTGKDYHDDSVNAVDQLHNHLANHYGKPKNATALEMYVSESAEINLSLIDHHLHNHPIDPHVQKLINKLDKSTDQRTPKDMHVYSGIGFVPQHAGERVIKQHLPAFTSTSLDYGTARAYSGSMNTDKPHNILKIHVPKGSRGVYLHLPQHQPSNNEFLLPRNAKLHIDPTPSIDTHVINHKDWLDGKGLVEHHYNIWHAKLVHDGTEPTRHADELE